MKLQFKSIADIITGAQDGNKDMAELAIALVTSTTNRAPASVNAATLTLDALVTEGAEKNLMASAKLLAPTIGVAPDLNPKPAGKKAKGDKAASKASPKAKGKATKKNGKSASKSTSSPKGPGKGAKYAVEGKTIHKLATKNPRREGTHGHASWEALKSGMTYAQYIEAGGRNRDLRWDILFGHAELRDAKAKGAKKTTEKATA